MTGKCFSYHDKCPQGFYKDKKIGDYKLSGLQINCSKDFENAELNESFNGLLKDWTPAFAQRPIIMPGEIKKVFTETTLGKAVYFQFHEVKQNPAPQAEELTNNLLFEFAVLEKDYKEFEDYLYPIKEKQVDINILVTSDEGLADLIYHEGKVTHVYNDGKGGTSKYCDEHDGHDAIPEGEYKCKESDHEYTDKNGDKYYGNPTIGVGHLIVGETKLQEYCDKGNISEEEIKELLRSDVKDKAEKLLKAALNDNITNAKLNQCQFDALISIVFNRGIGKEDGKGFKSSTLWKDYIKKGELEIDDPDKNDKIKDALINDGSLLAGSNRRNDEADLYFNCKYKK